MRSILGCAIVLCASVSPAVAADAPAFKAGVAAKVITPTEPLWMAGYATRNTPCDTKRHDLWVKALALEDPAGGKLVLLTSDLCGIPRELSLQVTQAVMEETGLPRERLLLTCSHTHCGPVVNGNLMDMYPLTPEQPERIKAYTAQLHSAMVEVMLAALKDLALAKLSFGQGTARFAMNRREPTPKGIINGRNPEGPVDHSVPVLRVDGVDGKLKAVVFGYACHNTTMQFYEWCGDYAGFAQIELQKKHPGALALFWIGCGADANPLPRSKIELCEKYGKDLAEAVEGVLDGEMKSLTAPCRPHYDTIALPFDTIPTKELWEADVAGKNLTAKARATRMLKMLEAGQKIPESYPAYPIQVWRFGDELTWVALGGETVVDYARRLKKELTGTTAVWATGYANDVMAYIPSERVLKEGGYEGDTSMVPYGLPAKWAPGIEDKIVGEVHKLAK
jgi:hypothetical protein